jgi:Transposase DDE domain
VISTVDSEARHAHKTRSRRQDGYKAHLVVEPETGIVTDAALTPASGADNSDAAVGMDLLADADAPVELLADSAYGSGEMLDAARQAGHTPIIKPWPLRPAVEGGFTIDDFTVNDDTSTGTGTVTCPNGITRSITRTRNVIFGAACRDCPLRARCTTSTSGRTLRLHSHDALQREHRQHAQDPEFQAVYRQHRPMVERSIAWLVAGGNRRLRFRGIALNGLWLHHRLAGLNLRRLLALGLTRTAGAWALA